MATAVKLLETSGFQGGLNLSVDQFQLEPNESPDLSDVDVDPQGGFFRRGSITNIDTTGYSIFKEFKAYYRPNGATGQVLAALEGACYYSTGTAFTLIASWGTTVNTPRFAVMKDLAYGNAYTDRTPFKWDGSTLTALTASSPTFQNDYASPTGGYMPSAKCIAQHSYRMWVANTSEGGTPYRNRVRFSHPNRPEDWKSTDYFDIGDGADGDEIVALVPWADHLIVFKQRSIWAVHGYSDSNFSVIPISRDVGAVSAGAVCLTDYGVAFCNWPDGVYMYSGVGTLRNISLKVQPVFNGGTIPSNVRANIVLGWLNSRLWVSYPTDGVSYRKQTLVWDPRIDAWTRYSLATGPYVEFFDGTNMKFVTYAGGHVCTVDGSSDLDNLTGATSTIPSYYKTPWYDTGTIGQKKRWKRPDVAVRTYNGTWSAVVDIFRDYNDVDAVRTSTVSTPDNGASLWGTAVWGTATWGGGGDFTVVVKGPNLGTGRSVQLKFTGPNDKRWGIQALSLKLIPKRVR